ncbi:uncharacterized protein [Procambarus clarkii]|uniref:uncharacterized protein isoform X3 n=1 Tax=Procambarus clarkii TaxID=6728 RepID=UPI003743C679
MLRWFSEASSGVAEGGPGGPPLASWSSTSTTGPQVGDAYTSWLLCLLYYTCAASTGDRGQGHHEHPRSMDLAVYLHCPAGLGWLWIMGSSPVLPEGCTESSYPTNYNHSSTYDITPFTKEWIPKVGLPP